METLKKRDNEIAEALKTDFIKNCDFKTLNNTIVSSVTASCQMLGQSMQDGQASFIFSKLPDMIRDDFPAMRVSEIPIALRKGVMGEFGQFFGINVVSVIGFIKAYMASEQRSEQLRNVHKALPGRSAPDPEQIEKMETEMILMAFEKFKKDRRYEDFGNHVYHKLDARGMITFTNDVKHGFMKQARQNIEARNNPATASSLPERNKMLAFLEQLEAGDASSEAVIKSEAKKVALVEYFRGLVEMGVEIKELLTN